MILLFSGVGYPTPNMSVYKTTEAEPYLVGPRLQISRVRKQTRPAGPIFNFSRLLSTDVIKTGCGTAVAALSEYCRPLWPRLPRLLSVQPFTWKKKLPCPGPWDPLTWVLIRWLKLLFHACHRDTNDSIPMRNQARPLASVPRNMDFLPLDLAPVEQAPLGRSRTGQEFGISFPYLLTFMNLCLWAYFSTTGNMVIVRYPYFSQDICKDQTG